ncbi:QRFP-like peptide receptor [Glandiceps talaboti]
MTGLNNTGQILMLRSALEKSLEAIFLFLIFASALIGNIIVIIALSNCSKLRCDVSNRLIINLAATDLLSSVLVIPYSLISIILDDWKFGPVLCGLQCAFNYSFITVSMLTMTMISIDRYIAVTYPLRYNTLMTFRVAHTMIAYTWIQGIVIGTIPIIGSWVLYNSREFTCALDWSAGNSGPITYVICAFVICFFIPGMILVFAYSRICYHVWKSKSFISNQFKRKREVRTIVSILVISVVFFLCMTPFCVTKIFKILQYKPLMDPDTRFVCSVSSLTYYLASATNPLIYTILRKDFRRAFIQLVRMKRNLVHPG